MGERGRHHFGGEGRVVVCVPCSGTGGGSPVSVFGGARAMLEGSGVPTSWGERGGVYGATETTPSKFAINFLLDSNCRPDIIEAQVLRWRLPSALGRGRASRFSWLLESRGGGCFFAAEGGGIISGETGEWLSLCRVSVRVGDLRILFSGGATGISSCSRGGRGWWTPGFEGRWS